MHLELLPGAATDARRDVTRDDVIAAMDDARVSVASRDPRAAARAFKRLAAGRFLTLVIESTSLLELTLDAIELATASLTRHATIRASGVELGAAACRVLASIARGDVGRSNSHALWCATRLVSTFLEGVRRASNEDVVDSPNAVTSALLALCSIGSGESLATARDAGGAGAGAVTFESPATALRFAYALAYSLLEDGRGGLETAFALLDAWETVDTSHEYAVSRKCLFAGGALRRVLETVFAAGAIKKSVALELVRRCADNDTAGGAYVLAAVYRASIAMRDDEMRSISARAMERSAESLTQWIRTTERDAPLEARCFAFVSTVSTCLDMDGKSGPLRHFKSIVARATLRIFSMFHGMILGMRSSSVPPQEASRILHDFTTSPIFLNARFIAYAVSRHDDDMDASETLAMLKDAAVAVYDAARDIELSRDYKSWVDALDMSLVRAARANIYDFTLILLKHSVRGNLEQRIIDALFVATRMEFARSTSVEYVQVIGSFATFFNGLPSGADSPLALEFMDSIPELPVEMDEASNGRLHLTLRLLPFVISKLSAHVVLDKAEPFVRTCCSHNSSHIVKAAHVTYVTIFHAFPDLHEQLFPPYLRISLERYPASTPLEPLVAAIGLVTKFGKPGSLLALRLAHELTAKINAMDDGPPAQGPEDPPVEPLRRLLFQLVTIVDFPNVPAIQDVVQDAILAHADPAIRVRRHQTLAYTVMLCPDYARKPMIVDWVMRMSSKL